MQTTELINLGSEILKKKKILTHLLDSELILSSLLKKSRENLLISESQEIPKKVELNFKRLINRRQRKEPVAYLFEEKEFWKNKFIIDKNTLIPRPETELLVEKIVKYFSKKKVFFLDAGTGSGCIALSLLDEIYEAKGIGIDISKKALDIAIKNSKKFDLEKKVKFLNKSIDQIYGYKFDLIVSNPPYISSHQISSLSDDVKKYEPRMALDGGNDGLDVIKKVIYKSESILKRKGMLALEIGNGQYKKISQILKLRGFRDKFLIKDYRNNIRCILTILDK